MQNNKDAQVGTTTYPKASAYAGSTTSYLGPTLQIKGEITGHEDLKLDSIVDGLVSIGGFRLTVGPAAHLEADIVAREAIIFGDVIGDVSARDRIEIMKSASIEGNLSTHKIVIEEGAYFKGDLDVDTQAPEIGADLDTLLRGAKNAPTK